MKVKKEGEKCRFVKWGSKCGLRGSNGVGRKSGR